MKFITLAMIVREDTVEHYNPQDVIEEVTERVEIKETKPVTINIDQIRNFYPRKDNRPGARVVLKSGVAYTVRETHDQVLSAISRATHSRRPRNEEAA